jgi:predicted enzyme related to lactoylglutathione lyase
VAKLARLASIAYSGSMPKANNLRIDYIEFGCTDTGRVKQFYGAVFGWSFQDWGPGYVSFTDPRTGGGGFTTERQPGGSPLVVVYAEDLETTLGRVRDNGGVIVMPIFDFPGGRRFHFADPEGNMLAVYSEPA